jgi:transcriptional regulator with XRE-family HTH domain
MFRECFKQVKKERQITGRALSQASGVTQAIISEFINGKRDVSLDNFWSLLQGMEKLSPGSIELFCALLVGKSEISLLDEDQIADQIIALGKAWKELQESKAYAK